MITIRLPQPGGMGWQPGRGTKSHLFRASDVISPTPRVRRYWNANGWWGNQGDTSECTIYAWLHLESDGPITHKGPKPIDDPTRLYQIGQDIDGTPRSDVDSGLTSDAAAQAMKREGYIGEYRWALDLDEVLDCLLNAGPGTFGMNWLSGMDTPVKGLARYRGPSRGGHQVKFDGANKETRLVRFKQSWGRENYGLNGFGYMAFDDFRLALKDGGEFCIPRELLNRALTTEA